MLLGRRGDYTVRTWIGALLAMLALVFEILAVSVGFCRYLHFLFFIFHWGNSVCVTYTRLYRSCITDYTILYIHGRHIGS